MSFGTLMSMAIDVAAASQKQVKRPIYKISVNDMDKSLDLLPRLISFDLKDNRGTEVDTLTLTLDDSDGAVPMPKRGTKLALAIGWQTEGLVDKGIFYVQKCTAQGSPDTVTITATSLDLAEKIKEKKDKTYNDKTVGEIIQHIAKDNGLDAVVNDKLAAEKITHLLQKGESDTNLLDRLAERFDAICTVKENKLLFVLRGEAKTASGLPLPAVVINRQSGDQHSYSRDESKNFIAVKARWHDYGTGKRGEVIVDQNSAARDDKPVKRKSRKKKKGSSKYRRRVGRPTNKTVKKTVKQTNPSLTDADSEKIDVLTHVYASEQSARRAARSRFAKGRRSASTFSIALGHALPELMPELPVTVMGFKDEIDSAEWLIVSVNFKGDNGGLACGLELELKEHDDVSADPPAEKKPATKRAARKRVKK